MTIKKRVNSAKKKVKRQTTTLKSSFKRNAMSDKKANRTMGSRKDFIGVMNNNIAKTTTAGKVGAAAGVAARKTASKINSMKTKVGSMKKKGASKIGSMKKSAYKMTASHRAAISRALKGKRR